MNAKLIICSVIALCAMFTSIVQADEYVIVLPRSVNSEQDKLMLLDASKKAVLSIPAGDNIRIINGFDKKTWAKFVIPDMKAYKHVKVRKKQFKKEFKSLEAAFTELPILDEVTPQILLPQFLAHLSTEVFAEQLSADEKVNVLIFGDALFQDEREEAFNMIEGWFPSDGHIRESQKRSVFGTLEKRNKLTNFHIHFVHSNQYVDWVSDLHKHRIERFWNLYLRAMGGTLATFSPDMTATLDRFLVSGMTSTKNYTYDHTANKVEMLKVWRDRATNSTEQLVVEDNANEPPTCLSDDAQITDITPLVSKASNVIIGIRWDTENCANCDLDLYSAVGSSKWLFFQNKDEKFGRYFKDFTSAPNLHGLEYVQLTEPVKFSDIKTMVNFYGGKASGSAKGTLRVCFDGNTYEGDFEINAAQGNSGKARNKASTSPYWKVIDVSKILGITGGGSNE